MDALYCRLGGSGNKTLQVTDLQMLGRDNQEVRTADELRQVIAQSGATHVMFGFRTLPAKAVPVDHKDIGRYIVRVIGYLARKPVR